MAGSAKLTLEEYLNLNRELSVVGKRGLDVSWLNGRRNHQQRQQQCLKASAFCGPICPTMTIYTCHHLSFILLLYIGYRVSPFEGCHWTCAKALAQFACAYNATSLGTVNGPETIEGATEFMAWVGPDASQYLPFTGTEGKEVVQNEVTWDWQAPRMIRPSSSWKLGPMRCATAAWRAMKGKPRRLGSFLTSSDTCEEAVGYIWAAWVQPLGSGGRRVES